MIEIPCDNGLVKGFGGPSLYGVIGLTWATGDPRRCLCCSVAAVLVINEIRRAKGLVKGFGGPSLYGVIGLTWVTRDPRRGLNRGRTPESVQDPATRLERLLIGVPKPPLA